LGKDICHAWGIAGVTEKTGFGRVACASNLREPFKGREKKLKDPRHRIRLKEDVDESQAEGSSLYKSKLIPSWKNIELHLTRD
jgi:hypothetical protein